MCNPLLLPLSSMQASSRQSVNMCRSVLLALIGLSLGLINAFPTEQPEGGKNWVVIVAGSNGWYNYRHQVRAAQQQGNCFHNVTLSCANITQLFP